MLLPPTEARELKSSSKSEYVLTEPAAPYIAFVSPHITDHRSANLSITWNPTKMTSSIALVIPHFNKKFWYPLLMQGVAFIQNNLKSSSGDTFFKAYAIQCCL